MPRFVQTCALKVLSVERQQVEDLAEINDLHFTAEKAWWRTPPEALYAVARANKNKHWPGCNKKAIAEQRIIAYDR